MNAPELSQLRFFEVLLRERSLTRAASVLNTTQPALSKILARLRRHFDDPLFVRVSLRMEPTPRALELEPQVRGILEATRALRLARSPFDPRTSERNFTLAIIDAGVIQLVTPIVKLLLREAPSVRLRAVPLDAGHLYSRLESGEVDLAVGALPSLKQSIRRQRLFTETYTSLARKRHPRLGNAPTVRAFVAEQHVLVSASGTGHAHQSAERTLEAAIPARNIILRVPGFAAAAMVAKHTDAVATLPSNLAALLASELDLELIRPPIDLPKVEIGQYWHERFHREPGSRWIRSIFHKEFGEGSLRPPG